MTLHRLVIAGVAAFAVLAGAVTADGQPDGARPGGESPLILRDIAPPSADFTTYVEGELVRVSVPSNWRELPGSNAVAFAPDGAYSDVDARRVFTHGVSLGLAPNGVGDLRLTTDDFIDAQILDHRRPSQPLLFDAVLLDDRPGLHTTVWALSEATGEPQRVEIYTALLADGTLFYVLAVSPRARALDYAGTFKRVIESIEILDRGDR